MRERERNEGMREKKRERDVLILFIILNIRGLDGTGLEGTILPAPCCTLEKGRRG